MSVLVRAPAGRMDGRLVRSACGNLPMAAPELSLVWPSAGSWYYWGQETRYYWTSSRLRSDVAGYLSVDGGVTYPYDIGTAPAEDGSMPWTVPALDCDTCFARIESGYQGRLNDENGPFLIHTYMSDGFNRPDGPPGDFEHR